MPDWLGQGVLGRFFAGISRVLAWLRRAGETSGAQHAQHRPFTKDALDSRQIALGAELDVMQRQPVLASRAAELALGQVPIEHGLSHPGREGPEVFLGAMLVRALGLSEAPRVTIRLPDVSAARYLLKPSLANLGTAYVEGAIEVKGPKGAVRRPLPPALSLAVEVQRRHPVQQGRAEELTGRDHPGVAVTGRLERHHAVQRLGRAVGPFDADTQHAIFRVHPELRHALDSERNAHRRSRRQ